MLKPRKRISKKDLKEDKLVTFYYKATQWVNDYQKFIYGGIGAIIVLVLVVVLYQNSSRAAEEQASSVYLQATAIYQEGDFERAIGYLNGLVEDFGGTRYGKLARFFLAQSYFKTTDYEKAEHHFKEFVIAYSDNDVMKTAAMAGLAASMEQQERYLEAAQQFEKAVKKNPDGPFSASYLLRAARNYERVGDNQKAISLYDRIVADYPDAPEKNDALMLKALLQT